MKKLFFDNTTVFSRCLVKKAVILCALLACVANFGYAQNNDNVAILVNNLWIESTSDDSMS